MSKNLTRKGLALGAILALGTSLFAGAPAQAADDVLTLAPSTGTTYNTLATSGLKLEVGFTNAGLTSTDYANLKYKVGNGAQRAVQIDTYLDGSEVAEVSYTAVNYQTVSGNGSTAVYADAASGATAAGVESVTDTAFVTTPVSSLTANALGKAGVSSAIALRLVSPTVTGTVSYTVQAWIDGDNDGFIDAGEKYSPERTVNFIDIDDVVGSVSFGTVAVGDSTLTANVSLSNDINLSQVDAADIVVEFGTGTGTTPTKIQSFANSATNPASTGVQTITALTSTASNANDVAWNATDALLQSVFDPITIDASTTATEFAVSAATTYRATLKLTNEAENAYVAEGTIASSKTAADGAGYTYIVKALGAAGVKNVKESARDYSGIDDTNVAAADVDGTAHVKTDGRTFKVQFFVGSDVTNSVGLSDIPLAVTVSSTASVDDSVTVGGKTVYAGQNRSFNLTSGAGGTATLEVVGAKADDEETISFSVKGPNSSATEYVVYFKDAEYTATSAQKQTSVSIKSGDSYTLDYKVVDQWGIAPTDNTIALSLASANNGARTTAADLSVKALVVAGKASVTLKDNGVGNGIYDVVATPSGTGSDGATVTTAIKVVTNPAASAIVLKKLAYGASQANDANADGDYADTGDTDNTGKLILSTAVFANYDSRYAIPGVDAPAATDATKVTISGTVYSDASTTAVAGAPVTVSANGFLFLGNGIYGQDTLTVIAGTDGTFSVDAWSQLGGSKSVSIKAGAASASQALVFAAGTGTVKTFTFAPKSTTTAGRALDLSVFAQDKYSNAAQGATVTYSATGVGYLSANTATTDKTGRATVKLVLGSGETGIATVSATITVDGADVVVTKTILVGVTAKITKAKNSTAVVKNASGSTVTVVRGTKSVTKVATSDSYKLTVKGGAGTVKVYVDDIKVASK